ncbi:MAG TPA: chemotaxis protein CheA [Terriglobales bacterium]|nr:chemotaxis protein CheA [Terriglobales bacterium]
MSFFPEEPGSDLKELFFESARELLQALNNEGMRLEENPHDEETVRSLRRAVHTLKGDSAVCGYNEISELAHELEDVLTPEQAKLHTAAMAEMVLRAADLFDTMLTAYRNNATLPESHVLRASIRKLAGSSAAQPGEKRQSRGEPDDRLAGFSWTENQQLVIANAASEGKKILLVAIVIDNLCPMRAAALQLVRNVLEEAGTLLAIQPEDASAKNINVIEAAVATDVDVDWLIRKCQIPAVVSDIMVRPYDTSKTKPASGDGTPRDVADSNTSKSTTSKPTTSSSPPPSQATSPGSAPKQGASKQGKEKAQEQPEQVPVPAPVSPREPATQPAAGTPVATMAAADSTLRVDVERIDTLMNLVGELILGKSMLHQTITEFEKSFRKHPLHVRFNDALGFQARVLNELQKSVMKIRMVPVEQLFRRFPRLVRDVAKARGREVRLEISGENTDLDKSILDAMGEPLTHILRNAVDHGIESAAERVALGKPEYGTLALKAYHQGNQMVIEVRDDGRGIDRDKVVARAVESKVITRQEAAELSESDALDLIFHPGLSTAEKVTTISGRGVGMDVVKTVLERLKGSVHIETRPKMGTTFYLKVPLTLAIMKGLLFHAGDRLYALPLSSVVEITRAYEKDFHRVDRREVLQLREHIVTLIRLGKLNPQAAPSTSRKRFVIVVNMNENRFGLVVDKLVGEQELVIKALDDQWIATDLVSGASILGDGTVVLVLNMAAVISKLGRERGMGLYSGKKGATA